MTGRLVSIQILRAVAALFVVFAHQWGAFVQLGAQNAIPDFKFGTFGVDLFFVISGFVMVYTSEELFGRRGAMREFIGRRLLRIVPLYWSLTTLLIAGWFAWFGWFGEKLPELVTWKNVLGSYFFVPVARPHNGEPLPVLSVGWTLNYEMFFYCLFAATIFLRRNVATVALTVVIFAIAAMPFDKPPLSVWSSGLICEFAFGTWVALAYRNGWRINPFLSAAMIVAGLALAIGTYPDEGTDAARPICWGFSALLIVAGSALCNADLKTGRWLIPLVAVGDASYALYLVHPLIPLAMKALRVPNVIDPVQYAFVYGSVSIGASIGAAFALNAFDHKARAAIRNGRPHRQDTQRSELA